MEEQVDFNMPEEEVDFNMPGEEPREESRKKTQEAKTSKERVDSDEDIDSDEDVEMKDVEILEFSLTKEEINELIEKLDHLKKTKREVSFAVDDENEFLIRYAGKDMGGTRTDISDMGMRG